MKFSWRYIRSFFNEVLLERGNSKINPGLEVWYAYGRKMLNAAHVNYSYGKLDNVFRSAFKQLQVEKRGIENVLLLGLGAGNVCRILQEKDPQIHITAIEIDPEVYRLAQAHFELREGPNLAVIIADATKFVYECDKRFDMVIVDIFVDDQIPDAGTTENFLLQLAKLLQPKGVLIYNRLAHTADLRQQTEAFGRKMMAILPSTRFMNADLNQVLVYEKI